MATEEHTHDEHRHTGKTQKDLQELLSDVGLDVEYWEEMLKKHLNVKSAQALQHLSEVDLQKLESHTQHSWEKSALKHLIHQSQQSYMQKNSQQNKKDLQELKNQVSKNKQGKAESVRGNVKELRQEMEIPKEYTVPSNEKPSREVMEKWQKQPEVTSGTQVRPSKSLSDKKLVRCASGGLALQGIYITTQPSDLLERKEELLRMPQSLHLKSEQSTRIETVTFTSSQEEFTFTQCLEKLGFSLIGSAKIEGWKRASIEIDGNYSNHSESKEIKQSHFEKSYFCSKKYCNVPLASYYFSMDQLQLSKPALQELKCIEELLDQTSDPVMLHMLRNRTEKFFHRFGSHACQGPLLLGGIFCWKAVSEGFQKGELEEVKRLSANALDNCTGGKFSGFGVNVVAGVDMSRTSSKTNCDRKTSKNLQANIQLSMSQTGGPPDADDMSQWKAGLVASNQTWHVIDRGDQLVPIWDIILSNHRSDFKDALRVATCLKKNYTDVTGISTQLRGGEEVLSACHEARKFLEAVKSWEVSDPEEQLKNIMQHMQMLNKNMRSYDKWIDMCLADRDLQKFLVDLVDFCKESSKYNSKFIRSQLRSLLDPHVYSVKHFPHTIKEWIQSEPEQGQKSIHNPECSELIKEISEKCLNDSPNLKILAYLELYFLCLIYVYIMVFFSSSQRNNRSFFKIKQSLDEKKAYYERELLKKSKESALAVSKSCVDFLRNRLSPAIFINTWQEMINTIAEEMRNYCPEFSGNRANLEKHILISLAEEENFGKYRQYIHHPESFFRSYTEAHIRKYCSDIGNKAMKDRFKIILDGIKYALLCAVQQSTAEAKDKRSTASQWSDMFCRYLESNLIFPPTDLIDIEHQKIEDMGFLKEAMSEALDDAINSLEKHFQEKLVELIVPPVEKILSEQLYGCLKQCPFCGAICTNTIAKHDGDHSVSVHRPQAVKGITWNKTDNFVIDLCTSLVAGNYEAIFPDGLKIPFKNYRQAGGDYATWSIAQNQSTQPYWMWFVSHFRSNLAAEYQKKFADKGQIPESWARITKRKILDDLKK